MPHSPGPGTRRQQGGAIALLLVTAFIWGMCFVAQRSSMEFVGPFIFNGIRLTLGAITLCIVLALLKAYKRPAPLSYSRQREILIGGALSGFVLFIATNLQQVGMVTTSASKAGFITTLYIVLVPILGIALRQKTHWNTWLSVAIAAVGLYLLCISEAFTITSGDMLLLACALFWALHILCVGHFVLKLGEGEVIRLCVVQFLVGAVLSLVCAPLFDFYFVPVPLSLDSICQVLPEIAYAGFLSSGVAFTLQAVGQKYARPAPAALIMSLEAVFALLGGFVILNEVLAGREITGCILMFAAVVLAQVTFKKKE